MAVTAREFRQMALSFPETEARSHMGHPDFRVAGKIFATLGYPDKDSGMVKVTPMESGCSSRRRRRRAIRAAESGDGAAQQT